jgi:hypothetical protein
LMKSCAVGLSVRFFRVVSLPSGDEVPHIFTRKSRLQPREFLISSAKRLLQQYRPDPEGRPPARRVRLLR